MASYKLGKVVIWEDVVLDEPEDRVEPKGSLRRLEYDSDIPVKVEILHVSNILERFYVLDNQDINLALSFE